MIVSNETIKAAGLGDFFMFLGRKGPNASKKIAKTVLKNPRRALETGTNVGTSFEALKRLYQLYPI